jgi:hypothetical protein
MVAADGGVTAVVAESWSYFTGAVWNTVVPTV